VKEEEMGEAEERVETVIRLQVPDGYQEEGRLDVYITRFVENASRTKVQRSIREGHVTVNGEVVTKVSHTVLAGDEIVCRVMRPPPMEAVAEDIPLNIVFEDDYLIVVNKAAGMVVHPAYGNRTGTLVNALLHHVGGGSYSVEDDEDEEDLDDDVGLSTLNAAPSREGDPSIRPGIVHRLDKDTSGMLVVAKDDMTHRGLAKQFEEHTIQRRYLAIVWGVPDLPKGTIDTHVGRDPRDRKRMAVVRRGGKHAVTHYETVEAMQHTSLVQFRLETGRTHQIRVHAQHIGHPVLGDATYGGQSVRYGPSAGSRKAFFNNLFARLPRQALHAHTLGFLHPITDERLYFTADLPADMQYALDQLRRVEG
jgi:23S rRNA pseudouridine1911/1915/1917 synthase